MRALSLLLAALFLSLSLTAQVSPPVSAGPALATHEWTADPPKQAGMAVLWCTASATQDGDTLRLRNYLAVDGGTWNVRANQQRLLTADVVQGMLYAFPGRAHAIQPSDVTVVCDGD